MYVPECIEYRYHRIANLRGSPVATEYAEIKNLRALLTLENVYHAGNRTPVTIAWRLDRSPLSIVRVGWNPRIYQLFLV